MDGPPPPEEDFTTLSVADRLAHKNWKARVSGYETLVKTFQNTASDTDPAFRPYLSSPETLKKIVTDSNAVAQEKGVETVVAFVKFAGENAARTREAVVPALVDKCLGSARAGTKTQAIELVLQYAEVENGGAGVVADILPGLAAKQPKVVAGAVTALKELIKQFGTQAVPPPPVLKALPKIFAHSDKTVRSEGSLLVQGLYQCLGAGIEPWLADLKPVQVKELKEGFEKMDAEGAGKGTFKAQRYSRAQAREMEAGAGADEVEEAAEEMAAPDPRAFAEEVDIVPKLPSGLQAGLASSKWKERKEVLDDLLTLLNATQRIKDGPELGEVVKGLAGRMSDANINCVITAANCLEAFAKGMMGSFGRFREATIPPMLERLKERKQSVGDAIGLALDAVFATSNLPDVINDVLPALSSKNPQVKEGSLKFLTRCFSTSKTPPAAAQVKPVSEALAGLLEDSFEGARNEAAVALGTLMKIVGERPLNAIMDQLADVRKVKVKDAYEKATVKCKAGAGGPPKPPPAAAKAPPKKAPAKAKKVADDDGLLDDVAPPKPAAKPPARLMKKPTAAPLDDDVDSPKADTLKPAAKPPARLAQTKKSTAPPPAAAAAAAKSAKSAGPVAPGALDTFKYRHTPEDAEALAADLIPSNIATDLGDANWKLRLAATEEMTSWLEGVAGDVDSEVVVRFIAKKGWNEKNFQVSSKLYGILCILAEKNPNFGRSCIALSAPHLSEKLGDMKLKKPAGEALMLFAEKTSLQFVLNQAYDTLAKQKAPKVLADSITWIESALNEFGVAGVSLRALIDFLKVALGNSNAAVRTSATKALVKIKVFVGPSVKDLLGEINPQLLSTITSEFDKVEGQTPPEPTRTSADVQSQGAGAGAGPSAGAADAMDDLFPRVEIDGLIKGTSILADAKSDQWKMKKEALEALQAILDQGSNKRLKPNMGEIGQVLKSRVTDTNKAVQLLALDIVARIASGMNKPFEKQTRFFTLPVASALSDQKANIRTAALQTLTAMAEACEGIESMSHYFTTALETQNPIQRSSLLNWIADWFKGHEPTGHLDLNEWVAPVISCLEDRSGDVRKAAQAVLPVIVSQVGFDKVMQQTASLKPASRGVVIPLVKAAAAAAPQAAPPPAKQQAQPAKAAPAPKARDPEPAPVVEELPVAQTPAPSKLNGVRRKLPQAGTSRPDSRASMADDAPVAASRTPAKPGVGGIKRPGSVVTTRPASSTPIASASAPFVTMNLDAKKSRLAKDGIRFVVEPGPVRKDLVDFLHAQVEPHASKELLSLLFSKGHDAVNDYIAGLGIVCDFYSSLSNGEDKYGFSAQERQTVGIANADLVLKYVSIRIHETMPSLISKSLDVVENVTAFFREVNHQISDPEAMVFIPTMINKLGDAREAVRIRVQQIMQTLPKVYPYSRLYQLLLDYGLKSKVAKTRQGAIDELSGILKRTGVSACDPQKSFPVVASMISDKDASVRKSALSCLSEGYVLVGEKLWSYVGPLNPKDKTQLEERLRRVAGPSNVDQADTPSAPPSAGPTTSRFPSGVARPASRIGGIPRPASPALSIPSRLARPASPSRMNPPASPAVDTRSASPAFSSKLSKNAIPTPTSPRLARPKSFLPSRLGPSRSGGGSIPQPNGDSDSANERPALRPLNGEHFRAKPSVDHMDDIMSPQEDPEGAAITVTISKILSSDPSRSVNALKQIQRILEATPEEGPSNPQYRDLSDHTEGLVETITLQMSHAFEKPSAVAEPESFRLAKHLIQTINAFCDHPMLAESLQVDTLTPLFEELTLRLLQTDESDNSKVKDLSRFINLIILRLFATGRRMTVLRSLFALLLQIVKPFPVNGTMPDSREAKVAELVLKCIWKLARNIPGDLEKQLLDPIELFPAIEHFLQSIPPNEWRARATNKVPSGDMPLRTIKVIIQHVVAFYGDVVYDMLSNSFDDPSATIVYPYVFRILNTSRANAESAQNQADSTPSLPHTPNEQAGQTSRPVTPAARSSTASIEQRSPSRRTTDSATSSAHGGNYLPPPVAEPDPDDQLITIINHISSETTGAMHKEGITELHHFLKAYPHKKPRVDRMLENTGPAFRKYIARALASRAAEDEERGVAVADTLSKLESKGRDGQYGSYAPRNSTSSESPKSPKRGSQTSDVPPAEQEKLNRLHNLFHYRSSTTSNGSSARSRDSDGG